MTSETRYYVDCDGPVYEADDPEELLRSDAPIGARVKRLSDGSTIYRRDVTGWVFVCRSSTHEAEKPWAISER